MEKRRIGIPRAFFYYIYYPARRTFFETLGFEVLTSPATSKETVDRGIHDALAEACVPVTGSTKFKGFGVAEEIFQKFRLLWLL